MENGSTVVGTACMDKIKFVCKMGDGAAGITHEWSEVAMMVARCSVEKTFAR